MYSASRVQDTSNAHLRHWNWASRPLFKSPHSLQTQPCAVTQQPASYSHLHHIKLLHLRNPSLMDFNRSRRDGWLSWPCSLTGCGNTLKGITCGHKTTNKQPQCILVIKRAKRAKIQARFCHTPVSFKSPATSFLQDWTPDSKASESVVIWEGILVYTQAVLVVCRPKSNEIYYNSAKLWTTEEAGYFWDAVYVERSAPTGRTKLDRLRGK